MRGDGDGWVRCAAGHRHWGRYGAAGLLLTDGTRAVLQHRAPWTHEGDVWGLPGGARDSLETPVQAALREAHEEAALDGSQIEAAGMSVNDHGGWSYTTVVARPLTDVTPHAANAESVDIRWWNLDEIHTLPLHPGLAASWPALVLGAPRFVLLVPSSLLGAGLRLRERGVRTLALPPGLLDTRLDILLPRVIDDELNVSESDVVLKVGTDVPTGWLQAQLGGDVG
jgi:8-oxo-dGTP diphosphatase